MLLLFLNGRSVVRMSKKEKEKKKPSTETQRQILVILAFLDICGEVFGGGGGVLFGNWQSLMGFCQLSSPNPLTQCMAV